MRLKDRVAIVTGAAGGIGRAIALKLAQEGANIAVADMNLEGATGVAGEVKSLGREALAVKTDVSDHQEVNDMVKAVLDKFGRIDILMNDAGGSARERGSYFHASTEDVWDMVLAKNLKGTMHCTRAVINHMMERKSGKIVNMGSVAGVYGQEEKAEYSAAKGAIIAFTKALALEAAPHGITVNCVSPGVIDTLATRPGRTARQDQLLSLIPPMGRLGTPEDVANLVAFLVSDEAAWITGQNYLITGGR
ncbi:MAG: glucose 1-dehydrogenase [Dehalococcoidia bacterium]